VSWFKKDVEERELELARKSSMKNRGLSKKKKRKKKRSGKILMRMKKRRKSKRTKN